jgi:hypothetical protein
MGLYWLKKQNCNGNSSVSEWKIFKKQNKTNKILEIFFVIPCPLSLPNQRTSLNNFDPFSMESSQVCAAAVWLTDWSKALNLAAKPSFPFLWRCMNTGKHTN